MLCFELGLLSETRGNRSWEQEAENDSEASFPTKGGGGPASGTKKSVLPPSLSCGPLVAVTTSL